MAGFELGFWNAWLMSVPFLAIMACMVGRKSDVLRRMSDMTGYFRTEKLLTVCALLSPYPPPRTGSWAIRISRAPQREIMDVECIIDAIRRGWIHINDHADEEAEAGDLKFDEHLEKCPVCGGEMAAKEVEKFLRGGLNTATLKVSAEVCLRCGEWLYSQETVRCFERIREKLERDEVEGFQPMGQSFRLPSCDLDSLA
jgi:YgiT-type zinc finger domain-containing protein